MSDEITVVDSGDEAVRLYNPNSDSPVILVCRRDIKEWESRGYSEKQAEPPKSPEPPPPASDTAVKTAKSK